MWPRPRGVPPKRETHHHRPQDSHTTTTKTQHRQHTHRQKPYYSLGLQDDDSKEVVLSRAQHRHLIQRAGSRFSPGDHQSIVGAGAPQRHLLRGNDIKRHRCRRQRQSQCRVLTRGLSTTLQKKALDLHPRPLQPTTPRGDHTRPTINTSTRSTRAAGRSTKHRTPPNTMPTKGEEHYPRPRTTMIPGCDPATHATSTMNATARPPGGGGILAAHEVDEDRAPGPSGAQDRARKRAAASVARPLRPPPHAEPRRRSLKDPARRRTEAP